MSLYNDIFEKSSGFLESVLCIGLSSSHAAGGRGIYTNPLALANTHRLQGKHILVKRFFGSSAWCVSCDGSSTATLLDTSRAQLRVAGLHRHPVESKPGVNDINQYKYSFVHRDVCRKRGNFAGIIGKSHLENKLQTRPPKATRLPQKRGRQPHVPLAPTNPTQRRADHEDAGKKVLWNFQLRYKRRDIEYPYVVYSRSLIPISRLVTPLRVAPCRVVCVKSKGH